MENTPTVEELNVQIERLTTGDLAQAHDALATAKSNFGKQQKSASVDELLALAELVKGAQTGVERVNASVAVARKRIATIEWESKSVELRAAGTLIAQSVRDAIAEASDVLIRFKVTGYSVVVAGIGTPELAINVKPQGPDIPKAPTGAKGGAGRGGFKSSPLTVDGAEYASASAALRAFFPESGPLNRASIVSKLTTAGHTVVG